MQTGPRTGDAFGELMRAARAEERDGVATVNMGGQVPRFVTEIVERDDGWISGQAAMRYFCGPDQWSTLDRRALERIEGETLDIGAGPGRFSLALQERGVPVTALDTSPGTVEVSIDRGVKHAICATVDEHALAVGADRYDCFALFGNNLGLLESPQRAAPFLVALAAMARPGARIVAQGTDPYQTSNPLHLAYHAANRAAGRLGGTLRLRVRYQDLASEWFTYLNCTPDELTRVVAGTPWRVEEIDEDPPFYVAVLRLL